MQTNNVVFAHKQTPQYQASNYFADAKTASNHFDDRLDELIGITENLIS